MMCGCKSMCVYSELFPSKVEALAYNLVVHYVCGCCNVAMNDRIVSVDSLNFEKLYLYLDTDRIRICDKAGLNAVNLKVSGKSYR
jgi:hypothetical protein